MFPFSKETIKKTFPRLAEKDINLNLLVWTTTPWTIPLNRAVVLHPTAEYVVVQGKEEGSAFIVGEKRVDDLCEKIGIEKVVLEKFSPDALKGASVGHPYIEGQFVPVLLDHMVLLI